MITIEDAVHRIYQGQANVAVMAKEAGVEMNVLKDALKAYISQRPVDSDVWMADVELGWPWV